MPYIDSSRRVIIDRSLGDYGDVDVRTPGELNFWFTKIINEYLRTKNLNYQFINDVLGALEGTKLEFYRRVAVPYEEDKIDINGDVYDEVFVEEKK